MDCDDLARLGELGILQDFPATTTWETRPGRSQMLYICRDWKPEILERYLGKKIDQIKFYDCSNRNEKGIYKHLGEIQGEKHYGVIPPSVKKIDGQRVPYRMLNDLDPVEISLAWLLEGLQARGGRFTDRDKKKLQENAEKLEKVVTDTKRRRVIVDGAEISRKKYVKKAIESELDILRSTSEGNRNDQLNRSSFSIGTLVGAGYLTRHEAERELSRVAKQIGLKEKEIENTIESGLSDGIQNPRKISELESPGLFPVVPEPKKDTPKTIAEKAFRILSEGDPVEYIIQNYSRLHVGDIQLGKILLCSIASQSVLNGEGLQPKLSGESGKGKTHACKAIAHLAPKEWVLETSLSAKALYYYPNLKPGMIIFSDDILMSEDLESTLKRAMTNFQVKTKHLTLDSKRNVIELQLPERLVWWLTSVSDEGDIQLLNRFMGVGIDDSVSQDNAVSTRQLRLAETGKLAFPEDEEVLVCREIIRTIKEQAWQVIIPFASRIVWYDASDRRNLPRFLELIRAFAVLRHAQREQVDGMLKVDKQDFEDARALYQSRADNQLTKLTDSELALARWMAGKGEINMGGILASFKKPNGKAYSRQAIQKMLHGNDDRSGMLSKVPALDCYQVSTKDYESGRTVKRNVYILPKFDVLGSFGAVVGLRGGDPPNSGRGDPATDCNQPATSLQPACNIEKNSDFSTSEDSGHGVAATKLTEKSNVENTQEKPPEKSTLHYFGNLVAPSNESSQEILKNHDIIDSCSEVAEGLHRGCSQVAECSIAILEDITSEETAFLKSTYDRMARGKMLISGFSLADVTRLNGMDIGPKKCKAWLEKYQN